MWVMITGKHERGYLVICGWKVIQVGVMTGWRQDGCFILVGENSMGNVAHY